MPLPGIVFVGVGGAVDPFGFEGISIGAFVPKSLGRFLKTLLSLSLSELGGKGYDFPNIILAGRAPDESKPAEAEAKVDVELPAVDAEAEADDDDDAVVLVPGFNRGAPGLDLVLISPAELDLLGPIPIA